MVTSNERDFISWIISIFTFRSDYFSTAFSLGLIYLIAKTLLGPVIRGMQKCNPVIVDNAEQCVTAVSTLRTKCSSFRVLGMDCEWLPENKGSSKVALLQLASIDGYVSLFRLCNIGYVPDCLKLLLFDESILKTGVAVTNDAHRLLKDYDVQCFGCIDLRFLAKYVGLKAAGLGKMSELYLGKELDKSWYVRCSNWEARELSGNQIKYAAEDAYVSALLFEFFNNRHMKKNYPFWRMFWTNKYMWRKTKATWNIYSDKGFSEKSFAWHQQEGNNVKARSRNDFSHQRHLCHSRASPPSNIKQYSTSANTARKSPLYHNIFIQAPDGEVLCTCDNKKADWYLNKGIAHVVCVHPLTLRLNFEPSGRIGGEGYYAKPKNNICVVCGSNNSMRRKNIVPHEYRKYFPVELKDHSSHDVLLLCDYCHCKSQYYDQHLKFVLAERCNAPFGKVAENIKMFELPELKQVRSAARALLMRKDVIPLSRKKELEFIVLNFLKSTSNRTNNFDHGVAASATSVGNKQILNEKTLERLSNIIICVENEEYRPHGLKVVEYFKNKYLKEEDGIYSLERLWRNNFVKCMSPKYLPELWSVSYVHNSTWINN
ncbi:exonuclease 3'-5' domain-containing 2 [Lycorma delicatula]|uniref:exonuclease 3'-5' domain-containing 2 n=1 Tax=Lycorma delicatula TaxID=130591 RepID=UPI003F51119C